MKLLEQLKQDRSAGLWTHEYVQKFYNRSKRHKGFPKGWRAWIKHVLDAKPHFPTDALHDILRATQEGALKVAVYNYGTLSESVVAVEDEHGFVCYETKQQPSFIDGHTEYKIKETFILTPERLIPCHQ